jgi:glucose/arabinose dehydrogenase
MTGKRVEAVGRSFVCALALLVLAPAGVSAITLPSGFAETTVTSSLSNPTAMAFAPDGRLFICQQGGALRVVQNGALLSAPFLTVTVNDVGERGLLGVAFDPNFASNQYIYVYYTSPTPSIHNRVSRFTANGNVAVPGSELILLDIPDGYSASNHNGGAMRFSADGKLLIAVGERATASNAQSMANLLGKMLRMNTDGSIPTDNPFYNTASGLNRLIWVLGLRNPFSFDVQPGTGRVFINDVGQGTWEEVNDGIAGSNYGWPTVEGPSSDARFRSPVYAYDHVSTGGCAIVGGAFYNPPVATFPSQYTGQYFFMDLCAAFIRVLNPMNGSVATFATSTAGSPVDIETGPDGALYYLARNNNTLRRIAYTAAVAPTISQHPADRTVPQGDSVSFTVAASGSTPLSYQWRRNGSDIGGATSATYTFTVALGDNGAMFSCRVTNSFGSATSNAARLTVTSNTRPRATITGPSEGTLYTAGDTISFAGTGSDTEDGTLGASAFTWQVDFHHDSHTHPQMAPTGNITSGSFTIPTMGETSANVWYRIHLSVTDSGGLVRSVFRDVRPRVARLSFNTSPSGLALSIDGQAAQMAPFSFDGVAGIQRSIAATSPQMMGGASWTFIGWSDGGALSHVISTPLANTTYTATFRRIAPGGASGDLDGDGQPDLLLRNQSTGANSLWFMDGNTRAATGSLPALTDLNWRIVGTGDFNGDKYNDIVWRNQSTGANYVWFMNGPALVGGGNLPIVTDTAWRVAGVGDVNGDGRPDIVWRHQTSGGNYVWFMNGLTLASSGPLSTLADTNWRVVAVSDFNGDGRADLLWRHRTSGANYLWYLGGLSVMSSSNVTTLADTNWRIVGAGDFNYDRQTDILWRHAATGSNYVWFMSGANQVGGGAIATVADPNWTFVPSDF